MRIVATSDTHFPFPASKIPEGDVFIHAGDLMYSGYPDEWYPRLNSLRDIEGFQQKILVPGNHDYHFQNYEAIAIAEMRRQARVEVRGVRDRLTSTLPDGRRVLAIPYVTNIQGWAFNVAEEWLQAWLDETILSIGGVPEIIVSHAPVYGILDAIHPTATEFRKQEHVGSLAFNSWFYKQDTHPEVWIHGHIHENVGSTVVEGCRFYNVAMCDALYGQTNPAVVIDLE